MGELLKKGQKVRSEQANLSCDIKSFLGGGGQGEVYSAAIGRKSVAIKWYFPNYLAVDPGIRERLQNAIRTGAPNDRFLWPMEMVTDGRSDSFGYMMALREPRFKGLLDLIKGQINPSFRARVTTCIELASSYMRLHSLGLCYRDISLGNVFLDETTGEIRICDNDNVDVNKKPGPIGGTPEFMAPEIVLGHAQPSAQTDLFSLSLLIFHILCVNHPLKGRRVLGIRIWDVPANIKTFGTKPIFIFDPQNRSNEPVPLSQDDLGEAGGNALLYWPIYPWFIRDIFTRAFTLGLTDADHGRVRETEWLSAMVRLRDSIIYCSGCGKQNFYDDAALKTAGTPGRCWSCKEVLTLPPRIRIGQSVVMLNRDTQLFPFQVGEPLKLEPVSPIAEVAQNPANHALWGLKNLGNLRWVCTGPDGSVRDVEPGRSIAMIAGMKVHFGKLEGEIRA